MKVRVPYNGEKWGAHKHEGGWTGLLPWEDKPDAWSKSICGFSFRDLGHRGLMIMITVARGRQHSRGNVDSALIYLQ